MFSLLFVSRNFFISLFLSSVTSLFLLIRVKEESEKAGLKLSIKKTKILASCLLTSWQIEGEKVETVIDLIFLGSKITAEN